MKSTETIAFSQKISSNRRRGDKTRLKNHTVVFSDCDTTVSLLTNVSNEHAASTFMAEVVPQSETYLSDSAKAHFY